MFTHLSRVWELKVRGGVQGPKWKRQGKLGYRFYNSGFGVKSFRLQVAH